MAEQRPHLAVTPWTCPHCRAIWHSGRQYCIDCGYGMAPLAPQAVPGNGLSVGPEGLGRVLGQAQEKLREEEAAHGVRERLRESRVRTESDVEAQLRRSLAAESSLQEEVGPLRERVVQLEGQLRAQREQLVRGVQDMLQPVQVLLRALGREVPLTQVVPAMLEVMQQVMADSAKLRAVREVSRPQPVHTLPGAQRSGRELWDALEGITLEIGRLRTQVEALETGREPALPEGGYGTWVVTDQAAADLEQELLREQTQRGGMAYGL